MSATNLAQAIFDLRIARVRTALRLLAASGRPVRPADLARELGQTEATLASLAVGRAPDAWLARRLGFDDDGRDFLWTVIALEADPQLVPLAQSIAGADARRGATVALHVAAFALDDARGQRLAAAIEAHAAGGPDRVLVPTREGDVVPATPFVVPRRVRSFLAGRDDLEPLVSRFGGVPRPFVPAILDAAQQRAEATLARALDGDGGELVVVEGPIGVGRRAAVVRAAGELGRAVVEIDLARWEARLAPLEELIAAWRRECLLRDAVGLLSHLDAVGSDADRRRLAALLDPIPATIVATTHTRGDEPAGRRQVVRVAYPLPDAQARRELWRKEAGDGVDLDLLARRYRMGASGVARAAAAARLIAAGEGLDTTAIVAGVRASVAERLGELATRITVTQTWDDLVLPRDTEEQIQALAARVRHAHLVYDRWGFGRAAGRAQGVAAIFSGPPGTGKTMVAGLVARELELDLLQVDLSRIVSKWVGETEKQLAAVFDAAEAGHALLLFDEADALFGKRTADVKGAVDRYANLEVNYLLQRIEAFGGVTILTTNLETAIDPAVKRRLAAHVAFPAPELGEREALWRRMLPPGAPTAGAIDHVSLATSFPNMTGAHIRNAALGAAFRAAAGGVPLTQTILQQAARAEYEAMGRITSDTRGAAA